jgi:hypothetical protein
VLFLGGLQLFTMGMLGEYVGQMHLNINNRPQYVIKARLPARADHGGKSWSQRPTSIAPGWSGADDAWSRKR